MSRTTFSFADDEYGGAVTLEDFADGRPIISVGNRSVELTREAAEELAAHLLTAAHAPERAETDRARQIRALENANLNALDRAGVEHNFTLPGELAVAGYVIRDVNLELL